MIVWDTPGLQDALAQCLKDGLTASETARHLSRAFKVHISRCAVIGRAHRTKVEFKHKPFSGRERANKGAA